MPLKIWKEHETWEEAEAAWDAEAKRAAKEHPLKRLKKLPSMPGITSDTAKGLKWKAFRYLFFQKEGKTILRHILRNPLRYGWIYLRSLWGAAYQKEGDFFLYGVSSVEEFVKEARKGMLVMGFSYCQKPFECPSGRFTDQCVHARDNPVCRQCDIGKVMHAMPEGRVIPLIIPTVHYIGDQMFKITRQHKKVTFLITACEMTLEMFGDFGNMVGAKGIGVRLDGRICNTMRAFELSEGGIKPGLTVVTSETQARILDILKKLQTR